MNNFSGTQEFDGIRNLRYIADYSENIVISRTGFLLCSKILEQISDRITFTLKFTCIKWYATCCLWPDSHCVIDIIRSKSGFLNFLHGKVPGKLMYNSGYHFQMTEFFCSYIVIEIAHLKSKKNKAHHEINCFKNFSKECCFYYKQ